MKHIVFLLGPYYPNYSAVGYCAYQAQKSLAKKSKITAVAFRDDLELSLEQTHEDSRILRIETTDMRQRNTARAKAGSLARLVFLALRVRGALRKLLTRETVDWTLVQAYLDRLNTMSPKPDAIVPTVFPFETALAALAYKRENPKVSVFPYVFDDFVESGSLHILKVARFLKRNRHLKLEHEVLEEADAIIAMHPLRAYFESNFDERLFEKITFLEHPLLTRPINGERQINVGALRLCYTGSLIQGVREPGYLLDLLGSIQQDIPIQADFYVMGNGADKVRTEKIGDMVEIRNCGRVQKAEADVAVRDSDILLNIGEIRGKQVSSKIFEYMSTGKPIIHLAYVEDDAVSNILAKYPLALCLLQVRSCFADNLRQVEAFILENRSKQLSFDEVKAIYPEALPETTATIFEGLLKKYDTLPRSWEKGRTVGQTKADQYQSILGESKNDE